jgi:hypothetical protein
VEAVRHAQGAQDWVEINGLAHWGLAASFRSPALAVERGRQAIELARGRAR